MAVAVEQSQAPPIGSRIAAASALAVSVVSLVVLIAFTARDLRYVLTSVFAGALGISASWIAATNRRFRWWATAAALLFVGGAVASLVAAGRGLVAVAIVIAGTAAAAALGTWHCVGRSAMPLPSAGTT